MWLFKAFDINLGSRTCIFLMSPTLIDLSTAMIIPFLHTVMIATWGVLTPGHAYPVDQPGKLIKSQRVEEKFQSY